MQQQEQRHRLLIFCQYTSTVELLVELLKTLPHLRYARLDSTVRPSLRQAVVDAFNRDRSIDLLLLTTHVRPLVMFVV